MFDGVYEVVHKKQNDLNDAAQCCWVGPILTFWPPAPAPNK